MPECVDVSETLGVDDAPPNFDLVVWLCSGLDAVTLNDSNRSATAPAISTAAHTIKREILCRRMMVNTFCIGF